MSTSTPRLRDGSDLDAFRGRLKAGWDPGRRRIHVCLGTGCKAAGGEEVLRALAEPGDRAGLIPGVDLIMTGCLGFCERGTLVLVDPGGILYTHVRAQDVREILDKTVDRGEVIEKLLYRLPPADPKSKGGPPPIPRMGDVPFYKHQLRVVLALNGLIDPTRIEDYVREGGYAALAKVLAGMAPERVIDEVARSGLRGRGGAGFPTGQKWLLCRAAPGTVKYVICNGDEGDPGAFMDRSILEGNPHSVIEGMCIGAYAVGASRGWVYARAEYPLAVERLRLALDRARDFGLLGDNILGSGFSFEIDVVEGAGAFVCGEETALIASIEGRRGMPVARPPFPAVRGLFGQPTTINNVETWATVPLVLSRGPGWFAGLGTERSKGTKIFSLVGAVNNTGLVEVPMGMTLRQVVYDIGGGIKRGRPLKAVQTGGPSGGCIPAALADLPIDYDSLTEAGSMMGSGGLVVMDERTCMVDLARYFLAFTQQESCGKCVPCRLGTKQMLMILEEICAGRGSQDSVALLETLADATRKGSLCGLGQTAPNPVLTTIRYFRDEYEAHIRERRCPGRTCKALISYRIDEAACTGCQVCARNCPVHCIAGEKKKPHVIDAPACVKCGSCEDLCKFDAVVVE